jgi:hypothetical protein
MARKEFFLKNCTQGALKVAQSTSTYCEAHNISDHESNSKEGSPSKVEEQLPLLIRHWEQ